MNDLKTERISIRTRYVFVFFFLAAGFSAMKSGSVPAVYLSIFTATCVCLLLALANQLFIVLKKVSMSLIIIFITVEVALIFSINYAFHFFPHIVSYSILIMLGVLQGGMLFTTDPTLTFTPNALGISHEFPTLHLLGASTCFITPMADFTNKNFKKIEGARSKAHGKVNFIHELLSTAKLTASDLLSQSRELKTSTDDIHLTIDENKRLIDYIARITREFGQSIASLRDKIDLQSTKIERNFVKISQISEHMEDIYRDSTNMKEIAAEALKLAESNERHILESVHLSR